MRPRKYSWYRYKDPETDAKALTDPKTHQHRQRETIVPGFPFIHLWDGGVYDNHALEGLHDFLKGWREDIEFFIVSDGAGRSKPESYRRGYKALFRMVTGIMMEQVRSLRSRAIFERLINHGDMGAFLQMGDTRTEILHRAGRLDKVETLAGIRLNEEDVKLAAEFPTTIKRLTEDEFDRLFRHGFEVANDNLYAYHERDFKDIPCHPVWSSKAIGAP
jgi:NTE family protein